MNDISFYNHKYSTLESLLTSKGDLNSSIIRREWFLKLEIYKKIMKNSEFLNIFEGITFGDRFVVLLKGIKIQHCPKCNSPYVEIAKTQHVYRTCRHNFHDDGGNISNARKKSIEKRKDDLYRMVSESLTPLLSCDEYYSKVEEYFSKRDNYAFTITEDNMEFLHDIILKTKNMIPYDKDSLNVPERLYVEKHRLSEIPHCEFCDEKVYFNNRKTGYSKTCRKHRNLLGNETRMTALKDRIDRELNFKKYDIMEYPRLLNCGNLVVKCKKCGGISEWSIHNGRIGTLRNMLLCRHCENPSSKEEESLYEFLRSVYHGKIIHHEGSRKIIPPYELDFYIHEFGLAIEFDGIYYHSELGGGKDRDYHLRKTEICEKKNIHLVHVFENEYVRKRDIVQSRLKNLLGIYDNTVYARKCEVREISNTDSIDFQETNHIQGGATASVNLGLFYDDIMISNMTFRKPRMNRKYEWELLRFCNKLGYHVIGGAGKLLKYFERTHHPTSIISYADRRWSRGNLYDKIGFTLDHVSKPNYWYFKQSNRTRLENRMKYQKHCLKKLFDNYDEKLTEIDNMRNNGYDRIFDCGNLVYVKNYENQAYASDKIKCK